MPSYLSDADVPDPIEVAERLEEYASGDGAGVYRDTMHDLICQNGQVRAECQSISVSLDGICDQPETLPTQLVNALRACQHNAQQVASFAQALESELQHRLEQWEAEQDE